MRTKESPRIYATPREDLESYDDDLDDEHEDIEEDDE